MRYCKKCGVDLKEAYKFCSICGCDQDVELNINEEKCNTIEISEDKSNKKEIKGYNNSIDKEKLIIGEICKDLY